MPEVTSKPQNGSAPYCPVPEPDVTILPYDRSEHIITDREANFQAYHLDGAINDLNFFLGTAVYPVWHIDVLNEVLIQRLATQYVPTQAKAITHIVRQLVEKHDASDMLYYQIEQEMKELQR